MKKKYIFAITLLIFTVFSMIYGYTQNIYIVDGINHIDSNKTDIKIDDVQKIFWQNDGIAVSNVTNDQNKTLIISDGEGGAIIIWEDYRNYGSSGVDIYAQRINSTGHLLWDSNGIVVCNATGEQRVSAICSDDEGGAIISWDDNRIVWDIYAQRIDSTGQPNWTNNGVIICNAINQQYTPSILSDGQGGAFIAWLDGRVNVANADIYAQRVNSSGDTQWNNNGVVVSNASNGQYNPKMCTDGSGGAIIVWPDNRDDPEYDIYAQRFDSNGTMLWTANGTPICTIDDINSGGLPEICNDGANGAIIVWPDHRGVTVDAYAQLINSTGDIQWDNNGTPICALGGHQEDPQLCSDGNGGAIITWYDTRTGFADIYVQHINASGILQWGGGQSGLLVCNADNHQLFSKIISDGDGGAIVTWDDQRGSDRDIYAQRVNSSGELKWEPNGTAICTAAENQMLYDGNINFQKICSDGEDGAIIVWIDNRTGTDWDIYAQRIGEVERPTSNHPGIIITEPSGTENISWVLQDEEDSGKYRVWANDTNGNYYIWRDWQDWLNNSDLQVEINRTLAGIFNYTIEYNNNLGIFGIPDMVIVYVSTNPTSNHPNYVPTTTTGSETIGWILWDAIGPGKYRVWSNDTNNVDYIWIDWTNWSNNTNLQIPINRTATGRFHYTIEFNNSLGKLGTPDIVSVDITLPGEKADNSGMILVILLSQMEEPPSILFIIIILGVAAAAVIIFVILKQKS